MEKTIGAIYENGMLRSLKSLHLAESQQVLLTIHESADVVTADKDVLDHELLKSLESEELADVSLEDVQAALAKIPGSMTAEFIAEREERF